MKRLQSSSGLQIAVALSVVAAALLCTSEASTALLCTSEAWMPPVKIRGVNLGGLFIMEPWLQWDEWQRMGCGDAHSEFDCVMKLGQPAANAAFQKHWGSWITQQDIQQISSYGLNTIRIPLGYWLKESLVDMSSEHFPQGALPYLKNVCKWASDAGLYIILDLHGAPDAQVKGQAFTGQNAPSAGFYHDSQYERAYKWVEWMAQLVHTDLQSFAGVFAIELVNEPLRDAPSSLLDVYYPTAWMRIRNVENTLNIDAAQRLHIQMMDSKWMKGANPARSLPDNGYFSLFDDHNYVSHIQPPTRDAYLSHSCNHDDRSSDGNNSPLIVGEWSLAAPHRAPEELRHIDANKAWYSQWWAAQVLNYEKTTQGWIFWTWKVNWMNGREDWRWGYQQAVAANVIPADPSQAASLNPCANTSISLLQTYLSPSSSIFPF